MRLHPRVRTAVLTAHVVTSVGWLGAVIAYIALDMAASFGTDAAEVAAAYQGMRLIARAVIIPLALASVFVGLLNALGTPWGLARHYWVLMKLLLTVVATTVLLLESKTIDALATEAASAADPRTLPGTLPHSIGGLLVLLVVMLLSTYKPRGLTKYGWRKQQGQQRSPGARPALGG